MSREQGLLLAVLAATVAMFLWGRWRHDLVSVGSLLACVVLGLVPAADAFAGFGHPAVITVASVLILSRGLQNSGAIDLLTRRILPGSAGPVASIGILTALAAVLSAFMNNVGALALLMPVAIAAATRQDIPPGRVLMPVAFGSILGGMMTLIGTPPNLIVSGFRAESDLVGGFGMLDFTPVGAAIAAVGVLFLTLVGWRLVPARERVGAEGFDTGAYLTEARVPEDSKAVDKPLHEVEQLLDQDDAQIVGLIRNDLSMSAPNPQRLLRAGDILVIEAEPTSLASALSRLGLKLVEDVRPDKKREGDDEDEDEAEDGANGAGGPPAPAAREQAAEEEADKEAEPEAKPEKKKRDAGDVELLELVVQPDARMIGRSATDVQLRTRYGINLLALSRQGRRSIRRLRAEHLRAGDVLLMQGPPDAIHAFAAEFGCVPLATRSLRIPDRQRALLAIAVMIAAAGGAVFGLLPAAVSFALGVLVFMGLHIVPPRTAYDAVDWPVIVLLAALIPVAGAMASTGAADILANLFLEDVARGNTIAALAVLLVVTMGLSDFMNNAATAAVMCPIALSAAAHLDANPDTFLMAVAVGASCAFLTPIGHQNNTLILGPGGFRFGDYWRLGVPLELIVIAAGIPMLLWVWPP